MMAMCPDQGSANQLREEKMMGEMKMSMKGSRKWHESSTLTATHRGEDRGLLDLYTWYRAAHIGRIIVEPVTYPNNNNDSKKILDIPTSVQSITV